MRRAESAFTLLEVLAAVALLGILYTTLASVAMQGLRGEGTARRRLAASLLADERLGEIERELTAGAPLAPGKSEDEDGDFLVQVEVTPFAAPPGFFGETAPSDQRTANEPLTSQLGQTLPNQPPALLTIALRVSWEEGDEELSVQRITYGYDAEALASVLAAAPEVP